jgi:phosphate transport system substrate-binding protein
MRYTTILSVIFLGLWMFFPLQGEDLKWVGCGITKKAFMSELAAAYEKKTGTKIIIEGGGATKGIRATAAGNADMGGSCRHTLDVPEEKGLTLNHVAWDALVVVVQKENPVENINTPMLVKVLKGEIKNWKELGGPDKEITLFVRKGKISGVGLMTRQIILDEPDFNFSPEAVEKKSSGPVETAVGETPGGIGITGVSSAVKRNTLKILKVNRVAPSKGGVRSGRYVYYRPLYLVTRNNASQAVKKFIDFALGKEGQAIIASQGTVNLEEGEQLKDKFKTRYNNKYYDKSADW